MKPLFAATILAFCIAPLGASADPKYRAELSLSGSSFSDDDQTKSSRVEAAASLYFAPLPLNPDYPLAETSFVERAGGIEVAYGRGSYEDSYLDKNDGIADVSFALRLSHKDVPLTAFLSRRKVDFGRARFRTGGEVDIETKTSEVELGYFVQPRLHVGVGREFATTRYRFDFMTLPDFEIEMLTVAGRYLGESDGGHFSLNGRVASISQGPDWDRVHNREIEFGGRNYLDKKQYIGLWVALNSGESREDEGQWVRLSYSNFLTSRIEVFALFEKFNAVDPAAADHDAGALGVSVRF